MLRTQVFLSFGLALAAAAIVLAQGNPAQSPASRPRPKSVTPQTYPAAQIERGENRFAAQCGFCHGRDATGGESGPDLTRAEIVAQDVRGDKLGPLLRTGHRDAAALGVNDADVNAIVAFLHRQLDDFSALGGGRRGVEPQDLLTGNPEAGRAYFNGAGGCARCHSPTGDLAGVATRHQGLTLLQRMLYPAAGGRPAPAPPKAVFTLANGQTITAPVAGEDEFSITVLDPLGAPQTYAKSAVKVTVENPLAAHFEQLAKYTDQAMHDVYAFLNTLK
jgi:cytochrome c oxidase cbb3-type subunit 3